ncbi:WAT1-related protein At4g08300-like isoform X1 [Tasmannia lanceolata]|uniref:WAT1-related protein At4g08300-like isoform X1 n=1 Tax=Tasmannia lanceolata TaxID=3420 RepID=UPI0040649D07
MAIEKASRFMAICKKFKPHLLMVLAQIGYTFLYFITEASFNHGLNPHVYVTYRHLVGGVVVLPFAYFLERKVRPKLTLALFLEIFVLSLLGVSLTLNMYFASLRYTSPTFLSSMVNTIASVTFVIAVILRLEGLDLRSRRGMAKVLGTLVSLAGVMTMTLYKGSVIRNLSGALIQIRGGGDAIHENWLKGSILTVASCITWSIWYIMQAVTLKRYPAQLSLTTWMSFVGGAQSAVFAVCVEHEPAKWIIGFNIDLWSIIYSGVVCSGLIIFIQLWCTEVKGPVFVTMFNPFSTILVAFLAYFVLGERLYMGSIVGGVIVIMGLYMVLWGKEGDQQGHIQSQDLSYSTCEEPKKGSLEATSIFLGEKGDTLKAVP